MLGLAENSKFIQAFAQAHAGQKMTFWLDAADNLHIGEEEQLPEKKLVRFVPLQPR